VDVFTDEYTWHPNHNTQRVGSTQHSVTIGGSRVSAANSPYFKSRRAYLEPTRADIECRHCLLSSRSLLHRCAMATQSQAPPSSNDATSAASRVQQGNLPEPSGLSCRPMYVHHLASGDGSLLSCRKVQDRAHSRRLTFATLYTCSPSHLCETR
jgi:hypothetical protein